MPRRPGALRQIGEEAAAFSELFTVQSELFTDAAASLLYCPEFLLNRSETLFYCPEFLLNHSETLFYCSEPLLYCPEFLYTALNQCLPL